MDLRIGVDIGGTFTDWVMVDREGNVQVVKTPTTPDGFGGVFNAMGEAAVGGDRFLSFSHGTTLGTNALIQRRLPRVAIVTTKGVTAVLTQAARGSKEDIWDIYHDSPRPSIVKPRDRLEVTERTLSSGEIRTPLDEAEARKAARILAGRGIRTIAVCFLHSYTNGRNERRMKEIILEEYPEALVRTSHETIPRILEYERFTTTILNVALIPVMIDYLEALERGLRDRDYQGDVMIVQSAGGLMGVEATANIPVRTANSGPSAGAIAVREIASLTGFGNVIGLDIGGTSTDVSVTLDGQIRTTGTWQVEWGHPIMFPAVDITTVGAGGGSVAWFDPGGALRSGPHSMGAVPGPACYGKGGDQPTNTDAHVVLGNLRPGAMLGGAMEISAELAEKVIQERIGLRLGSDPVSAAAAVIAVAEANMANAIRLATMRRGLDPRDFAMVAFGGAGPFHGARVAAELRIPTVIVPPSPGLTSALGCLMADIQHDLEATMFYGDAAAADVEEMNVRFDEFDAQVRAALDREGIPAERQFVKRTIDMCYAGQWRVFPIPVTGKMTTKSLAESVDLFKRLYLQRFTFDLGEREVEVHGISVTGTGITDKYQPKPVEAVSDRAPEPDSRPVYWREAGGWADTPVWSRPSLSPGFRTVGPAVVEQMDSTTLVPPGMTMRVDRYLNLILDTTGGGEG
ncbi:MAG: hydantoinase/oxoprolinase family protein [Actinomycetia bacterium]|nr:hydantoinase/oxoprolinase family protein [Actinomycetes bacterium]